MSEIRYRVRHLTRYRYTGRIDLCHSLCRLKPLEDETQELLSHRLDVSPEPQFQSDRTDYFGNNRQYFSIQTSHERLEVVATFAIAKKNVIETLPFADVPWEKASKAMGTGDRDSEGKWLADFLLSSRACPVIPEIPVFVQPSLLAGIDSLALVKDLTTRIFREFQYVPGATDNSTPIATVLKNRKGVCQDFAHVLLACLRHLKIPARYVSGYIETVPPPGQEKLQGADATHAWVEAYTPASGWVGFDPTNDMLAGEQHIKLAHGRDYFDVQPLKGIFVGSSKQKLGVEVDVERF